MKETIGGQILTAKGIVICVLLLPVMFSSGAAEVLFELISPNEEYLGEFGCAVSGAGDINGDGYGDFIIGACSESSPSRVDFAGRTYLIDGLTGKLQQTLTSTNPDICGQFGCAVSGAGDINGDGYDDVIVGAHGEYPGGRVYAYDGLTGDVIQWFLSPNPAQYLGGFGYSVSGIGDVDGDGHNDVLIGAPHDHESGRVYIFERDSHGMPRTLISPNEEETGNFGCSVSYVGDTDGDECDDIVVGAWAEDPGISPELAGRAYVFDGYSGILRHTIISPNEEENGGFGNVVSGAGDVNGDGYADVIVGAWREDPGSAPDNAGRAYVYDGHTGDLIHSLISPNEQEAGRFGNAVSSAGDVNGDGYADVLVGTFGESQEGSPDGAGIAYIFDGKTGKMIHKLVSPNEEDGGEFGSAVSGESAAGDGPVRSRRRPVGGSRNEPGSRRSSVRVQLDEPRGGIVGEFSETAMDSLVSRI